MRTVARCRRAGGNNGGKISVGVERPQTLAQLTPKTPREMQRARVEYRARIRRPPQNRIAGRIPREDALPICGHQPRWAKIAAVCQQAIRMLARTCRRREGRRRVSVKTWQVHGAGRRGRRFGSDGECVATRKACAWRARGQEHAPRSRCSQPFAPQPTCSRKRSASRAAMQPNPAEVMAWR